MLTLTISATSAEDMQASVKLLAPSLEEKAVEEAIKFVRWYGYSVVKEDDREWETPADLAKRLNITSRRVCIRRKHPTCPKHEIIKGPNGRAIYIARSQKLDNYLKK